MRPRQAISRQAFLFTDQRVDERALLHAAQRLRPGDGVIFRHYGSDAEMRARLFAALRRIARRRGLLLLVAGEMPHRFADCDGRHGQVGRRGIVSMPVHDARELLRAARVGADMIFISPVFPTRSHAGARAMGPLAFRALAIRARSMGIRPYALGGMNRRRAAMLGTGFGAIDALV